MLSLRAKRFFRGFFEEFSSERLLFSAFPVILLSVELLLFASGVPARAFAFADGVRPPLFLIYNPSTLQCKGAFLVEVRVNAIFLPSSIFSNLNAGPVLSDARHKVFAKIKTVYDIKVYVADGFFFIFIRLFFVVL